VSVLSIHIPICVVEHISIRVVENVYTCVVEHISIRVVENVYTCVVEHISIRVVENVYTCVVEHISICTQNTSHCAVYMGWLWLVGSIQYRSLLQTGPIQETIFCKRDL